jgi:hypothetical protein
MSKRYRKEQRKQHLRRVRRASAKTRLQQKSRKLNEQPVPWNPPKMKLFQMPQLLRDDLTREQRLQAVKEIGKQAKEQFDREYPMIRKWFDDYDALYILATCIIYFISAPEGVDPEAYGKLEFPHHFVELLQAFALMQERNLSPRPLLQDGIRLKEEMKEIGLAMQMRSFFQIREDMTEEDLRREELLQTVRGQTSGVRNWAYHHQMFKMTSDLMGKIASGFEQMFGLDPLKIVTMLNKLAETTQDKFDSHLHKIGSFYRKNDYRTMLKAYHQAFPETVEMDDEKAKELFEFAGKKLDNLRVMMICHSDLRIADIFTVTLEEMLEMYGEQQHKAALKSLLDSWSHTFGDLQDNNPEHFILNNPCLRRPFIKVGETAYFSSVMGVLPHLVLRLLENMIGQDASLKAKYEKVRARYLEDETEAIFREGFPHGSIFRGSKWIDPESGKTYENDLALVIGTFMIVVECKSGSIDPPASRGAQESLKERIEELIVEPATQANRFIGYLRTHKGNHSFKTEGGKTNTFDNGTVNYYIPCGITVESMGIVSSNIKLPMNAGFIEREWTDLAPSISMADLECIFDLLPLEAEKVHYLARRREFERHVDYRADEIDLLGFYLDNGFNIGLDEYQGTLALNLTLKSKELDPYFVATAQGRSVRKPHLEMTKWWGDLLRQLSEKRPDRWIESSYILLNSTKLDQEKCEKEFLEWQQKVRAGKVPHKHNWVQGWMGPEERRFVVACYPYVTKDRTERNSIISGILSSDESKNSRGSLCIGIDVNRRDYPYSVLAITEATNLLEQL